MDELAKEFSDCSNVETREPRTSDASDPFAEAHLSDVSGADEAVVAEMDRAPSPEVEDAVSIGGPLRSPSPELEEPVVAKLWTSEEMRQHEDKLLTANLSPLSSNTSSPTTSPSVRDGGKSGTLTSSLLDDLSSSPPTSSEASSEAVSRKPKGG